MVKTMSKSEERFRQYEKLMKNFEKKNSHSPASCKKCPYYRPEFKFRSCLYSKCPFGKDKDIFRKHPLRRDKVSGNEVVRMKHD